MRLIPRGTELLWSPYERPETDRAQGTMTTIPSAGNVTTYLLALGEAQRICPLSRNVSSCEGFRMTAPFEDAATSMGAVRPGEQLFASGSSGRTASSRISSVPQMAGSEIGRLVGSMNLNPGVEKLSHR